MQTERAKIMTDLNQDVTAQIRAIIETTNNDSSLRLTFYNLPNTTSHQTTRTAGHAQATGMARKFASELQAMLARPVGDGVYYYLNQLNVPVFAFNHSTVVLSRRMKINSAPWCEILLMPDGDVTWQLMDR